MICFFPHHQCTDPIDEDCIYIDIHILLNSLIVHSDDQGVNCSFRTYNTELSENKTYLFTNLDTPGQILWWVNNKEIISLYM